MNFISQIITANTRFFIRLASKLFQAGPTSWSTRRVAFIGSLTAAFFHSIGNFYVFWQNKEFAKLENGFEDWLYAASLAGVFICSDRGIALATKIFEYRIEKLKNGKS